MRARFLDEVRVWARAADGVGVSAMRRRLREAGRRMRARAIAGALLLLPVVGWARVAEPALRLPLEAMDFEPLPASVLNSGIAAMTLHYVDPTHLLLTFSRRRLLARLPDAKPGDFDRNVDAVLLELPSGKVLARTSWRLRDAAQYLWPLGNGEFLLRERNTLTTFAPMRGLQVGKAFAQHRFLDSERTIGALLLSPSDDLLTLETLEHDPREQEAEQVANQAAGQVAGQGPVLRTRATAAAQAAAAGDVAATAPRTTNEVQVDFFRVVARPETGEPLASRAGAIAAQRMVLLPIDGAGLLTMLDQGKGHWAFDFHLHDGKVNELSPFDSSCRPLPQLVSRSEFIAFGCRGGQDRRSIGGFNFRGEEMWEQILPESYTKPELSLAPEAGRFALGRMVTGTPPDNSGLLSTNEVSAETVTVFQTESGRALLSLNLTPVLLAGGNFALSPDGSALAVVNEGAVEVYRLPEPNGKERKGLELARSLEPERSTGPVRLDAVRAPGPAVETVAAVEANSPVKETSRAKAADRVADAGSAAAEVPEPAKMPAQATEEVVLGDPVMGSTERRKPPTLYAPADAAGGGAGEPAGK